MRTLDAGYSSAVPKAAHPPIVLLGSGSRWKTSRQRWSEWGRHGVLAAKMAGARLALAVGLVLPGSGVLVERAGLPRVLPLQLLSDVVHGAGARHYLLPCPAAERRGLKCHRNVSTTWTQPRESGWRGWSRRSDLGTTGRGEVHCTEIHLLRKLMF